jgi:selenocysteine-specific elongation factor
VILQPLARRHRSQENAESVLAEIDGAPNLATRLLAIAASSGETVVPLEWLLQLFSIEDQAIVAALNAEPRFVLLPSVENLEAVALRETVGHLEETILSQLAVHHRSVPMAVGAEMESMRTQVAPRLSPKLFRAVVDRLERRGAVVRSESLLRLPGHTVALAAPEQDLAERAVGILEAGDLAPPDVRELGAALKTSPTKIADLLVQLERQGRTVRIAPNLFFSAAAVERARETLANYLREHTEVSAAVFRDLIRGSRKFSIALLDYFDRTGFTIRVGDMRRLGRGAKR